MFLTQSSVILFLSAVILPTCVKEIIFCKRKYVIMVPLHNTTHSVYCSHDIDHNNFEIPTIPKISKKKKKLDSPSTEVSNLTQ
jgi:hypothetical protein